METWGYTTCEIAIWNNEKGIWLEIVKVNENVCKLFDSNSMFWKSSFSGFFLCIVTLQVCNSKLKHISSKFWLLNFILLISLFIHHLFYPFTFYPFMFLWSLRLEPQLFYFQFENIWKSRLKSWKNSKIKSQESNDCQCAMCIQALRSWILEVKIGGSMTQLSTSKI